jgi:hypothetical protein
MLEGMGGMAIWNKFLVGKPEKKRHLGRPRYMLEDNLKLDFTAIGGECTYLHLPQERFHHKTGVRNVRIS